MYILKGRVPTFLENTRLKMRIQEKVNICTNKSCNVVGRTYRHDQTQYAAAHSDGRLIITLLCTHLTNLVQFIIKSL